MVTHPAFDLFFAALVVLNTIFMGIDVELHLADQVEQGESVALRVTRRIFTAAFTATQLNAGADLALCLASTLPDSLVLASPH